MKVDLGKSHFVETAGSSATWPERRGAVVSPAHPLEPGRRLRAPRPLSMRVGLLLGCAASVAVAAALGDPAPYLAADPELARLLRGMALLKSLMLAAGLAVIFWRLGHPITRRTAALYGVGASALSGATTLIWQLTWLGPAALVFHVGGFLLLLVAFAEAREGRGGARMASPERAVAAGERGQEPHRREP